MTKNVSCSVPETLLQGGWIVGGKTRLLDVWTASNITFWAPPFLYRPHDLDFSLQDGLCVPNLEHLMQARVGRLLRLMSAP